MATNNLNIIRVVSCAALVILTGCASPAGRNAAIALEVLATPIGAGGFVEHVILPATSQVGDSNAFAGEEKDIPTLSSPCWGVGC